MGSGGCRLKIKSTNERGKLIGGRVQSGKNTYSHANIRPKHCQMFIVRNSPSGSCRILPICSFPVIWSDAGRSLVCLRGVAIDSFSGVMYPYTEVSSAARIGLGTDDADLDVTGRDVCSGDMSTIAPRVCTSLELPCVSTVRSTMRS